MDLGGYVTSILHASEVGHIRLTMIDCNPWIFYLPWNTRWSLTLLLATLTYVYHHEQPFRWLEGLNQVPNILMVVGSSEGCDLPDS